jgi:O-antigen/teichoic acid export membrane protein
LSYALIDAAGKAANGNMALLYASITFLNIVFTYGMETAYFRFSANKEISKQTLFQTSFTSLFFSTMVLSILLILCNTSLAQLIGVDKAVFITYAIAIVAIDTIAVIPFAKLRQQEQPLKYAFIKIGGILTTLLLTAWFVLYSPAFCKAHAQSAYAQWITPLSTTELLLLANLLGSLFTFLFLWKEWFSVRFNIDWNLWKRILTYSLPFLIIGLGGMINEVIDRIMLGKLVSADALISKTTTAIYNFNYKLAIFITLFIQAFKMAAEPFFFNQSKEKEAPLLYAKVMHWFVITLCLAFLFTALFLDVWKFYIGPTYRSGIGVVPILLAANVCLGIYYNLAVWYKVSDNLKYGVLITLIGAIITLVLNYLFIPTYGMFACAWTTFICYAVMMILSYSIGQKHYPIPYAIKKISSYLILTAVLFFAQSFIAHQLDALFLKICSGLIAFVLFLVYVVKQEQLHWRQLPFLKR